MKFNCRGRCGNTLEGQLGLCGSCIEKKLEAERVIHFEGLAVVWQEDHTQQMEADRLRKLLADSKKKRSSGNGKYKYVLNWWRAKDIVEVEEEHDKLDIDKLEFNYMKYPAPSKSLDILFKSGLLDEYDYIIFTSPDLVVKEENIEMLINDIEMTDYDCVTCVCNVDSDLKKDKLATCYDPILGQPTVQKYKWINRKDAPKGLNEVMFNGRVLLAIRISCLKGYNFYDNDNDVPSDVKICRWCIANNIPIMCNFDNYMNHLRYKGVMQAGRKAPQISLNGIDLEMDRSLPAEPLRVKIDL